MLAAVFPNPQSQSPAAFETMKCTLPRHRTIMASLGEHSAGEKWATNEHKRIQLSSSQWNETNLNARRVNKGTRHIPLIKTHCLQAKHSTKRQKLWGPLGRAKCTSPVFLLRPLFICVVLPLALWS